MAESERTSTTTVQPYYGPSLDDYGNDIVGIETFNRLNISNGAGTALTSGTMRLTYFTPRLSLPVGKIITYSGTTAAGATPTLCRMGVYQIATNGDGTLVCACASDTSLWASTSTEYASSLASPAVITLTPGQRYAAAVLITTGAALPTLLAVSVNAAFLSSGRTPKLTASLSGQSDLPASFTSGSLGTSVFAPYFALTTT